MKKTYTLVILILATLGVVKGQPNLCTEIKKRVNDANGNTEITSPKMSRLDNVDIYKVITNDGISLTSIRFATTQNVAIYDAAGISVKFSDGSIINYPNDILCSYLNADDHYLYNGSNLMEEDDLMPFKTKKIIKFIIAGKEVLVTDEFATKFMAYVNCIDAIKK